MSNKTELERLQNLQTLTETVLYSRDPLDDIPLDDRSLTERLVNKYLSSLLYNEYDISLPVPSLLSEDKKKKQFADLIHFREIIEWMDSNHLKVDISSSLNRSSEFKQVLNQDIYNFMRPPKRSEVLNENPKKEAKKDVVKPKKKEVEINFDDDLFEDNSSDNRPLQQKVDELSTSKEKFEISFDD